MFVSSEEISHIRLRVDYSTSFFSLHRRYYSRDFSPEWKKEECCAAYAKHNCKLLKKNLIKHKIFTVTSTFHF